MVLLGFRLGARSAVLLEHHKRRAARLRQGRSVRYLLPDAVRKTVEASGIYSKPERR